MSSASSSSSSAHLINEIKVHELLGKTGHYDGDERFMATHDLISLLKSSEGTLSASIQNITRDAILRLIDDKNSDVATVAVKCLNELIGRINSDQTIYIVEKLANIVVDPSRDTSRDIIAEALQTIILAVPDTEGKSISPKLLTILMRGLQRAPQKEVDIEMAALSLVKDLVSRFGSDMVDQHDSILKCLTSLLEHPNDSVRKRASASLGPLVLVLDENRFNHLMKSIIQQMDKADHPGTYIQCLSVICRSAGVRVGTYLADIVPKIHSFLSSHDNNTSSDEVNESLVELWETCLRALESLILRCPNKITPYVDQMVLLAKHKSVYDPMYSYEDELDPKQKTATTANKVEDDWGDGGGDSWGEDGGDSWGADEQVNTEALSSSSDNSWQVRRAAFAVLSAFIRARGDLLQNHYHPLCLHLVSRFKERDVAVREDVLVCCTELVKQASIQEKEEIQQSPGRSTSSSASIDEDDDDALPNPLPSLRRTRSYEKLDDSVKDIVKGCEKLLVNGDLITSRCVFSLLSELMRVRQGLKEYLNQLIPLIVSTVKQFKSNVASDIITEALVVIQQFLECHEPAAIYTHIPSLAQSVITIIHICNEKDKDKAFALRVLSLVCKKHPVDAKPSALLLSEVYEVIRHELEQLDVSIDVKSASIYSMSVLLSTWGKVLDQSKVALALQLFLDRMNNESTCKFALKAVTRVASAKADISLQLFIQQVTHIAAFARKVDASLRRETVRCLDKLLLHYSSTWPNGHVDQVLIELSRHISEQELQLTQLVLQFAATALQASNKNNSAALRQIIIEDVLPRANQLVLSPVLQGNVLRSLIYFYQECVDSAADQPLNPLNASSLYQSLTALLLNSTDASSSSSVLSSVAQCLAGILHHAPEALFAQALTNLMAELQSGSVAARRQLSLLLIGELARQTVKPIKAAVTSHGRLLSSSNTSSQLEYVCSSCFDSPHESVKNAAAFALGQLCVSHLSVALPKLLALIESKARAQASSIYLLFVALKEVIDSHTHDAKGIQLFHPLVKQIIPFLIQYSSYENEATRQTVCECLGRLATIDAATLLQHLLTLIRHASPTVRIVGISSLRFLISPFMNYQLLVDHFMPFIQLVKDQDLEVRRQTMFTIISLVKAQPRIFSRNIIVDHIIPAIATDTKIKPELVKEIDYGAFKRTIDDGKPLRQAAFSTLLTLLECVSHYLNVSEIIAYLKNGVSDTYEDIQILAFALFTELGKRHGYALLEVLDQLPGIFMPTVKKNIQAAKGKEPEQALECLRAMIRTIIILQKIPGNESCTQFTYFCKQVQATALLKEMIAQEMRSSVL